MSAKPNIARSLPTRHSLAAWAVVGVGLAAFSYIFTIALAAACAASGVWIVRYGLEHLSGDSRITVQAVALIVIAGATMLLMAGTLVWSLIPRREKEEAPIRTRLTRDRHPRLFAEITQIAEGLGEPIPAQVYLVLQLNAFVQQSGGTLGFGGERVLSIGLPLLCVLNVSEFRAILAHEFGHYYSGDTRLGQVVRTAVVAMTRTLENARSHSALIEELPRSWVFLGAQLAHGVITGIMKFYWTFLLSAVQMISRRQEYRADEIACAAAGSHALVGGLSKLNSEEIGWFLFSILQVSVLEKGCRVSIGEGFARYTATESSVNRGAEQLAEVMKKTEPDKFDSHPPLSRRIAAAERLPFRALLSDGDPAPAIALLDDVDSLEIDLYKQASPDHSIDNLKAMQWERLIPDAYIPWWRKSFEAYGSVLGAIPVSALPSAVGDPADLADRIPNPKGRILDRAQRFEQARDVLACALAVVLVDDGWEAVAGTDELMVRRNGHTLKPYDIIEGLRKREISDDAWSQECAKYGFGPLRLYGKSMAAS